MKPRNTGVSQARFTSIVTGYNHGFALLFPTHDRAFLPTLGIKYKNNPTDVISTLLGRRMAKLGVISDKLTDDGDNATVIFIYDF